MTTPPSRVRFSNNPQHEAAVNAVQDGDLDELHRLLAGETHPHWINDLDVEDETLLTRAAGLPPPLGVDLLNALLAQGAVPSRRGGGRNANHVGRPTPSGQP